MQVKVIFQHSITEEVNAQTMDEAAKILDEKYGNDYGTFLDVLLEQQVQTGEDIEVMEKTIYEFEEIE